jgi:hypothetical protein
MTEERTACRYEVLTHTIIRGKPPRARAGAWQRLPLLLQLLPRQQTYSSMHIGAATAAGILTGLITVQTNNAHSGTQLSLG